MKLSHIAVLLSVCLCSCSEPDSEVEQSSESAASEKEPVTAAQPAQHLTEIDQYLFLGSVHLGTATRSDFAWRKDALRADLPSGGRLFVHDLERKGIDHFIGESVVSVGNLWCAPEHYERAQKLLVSQGHGLRWLHSVHEGVIVTYGARDNYDAEQAEDANAGDAPE